MPRTDLCPGACSHSGQGLTWSQALSGVALHARGWELNDLARRLDEVPASVELREGLVPAPASSDSGLSPAGRRILEAIEGLPEGEREAFDLVKIQGLTHAEAAGVLGVSLRTVKRWVSRGLRLLMARLADLGSGDTPSEPA